MRPATTRLTSSTRTSKQTIGIQLEIALLTSFTKTRKQCVGKPGITYKDIYTEYKDADGNSVARIWKERIRMQPATMRRAS